MSFDELARRLADAKRLGLSKELAEKIKLPSEDVARGQLMAMSEENRGPMSVSILAVYVVDDTDLWGDGEIYWWSCPVLVSKDGTCGWSPLSGLPTGMAPHKVGSLEWMQNITLNDPPLVAVIPPDEEITECVIRLAIYDDDGKPADIGWALSQGIEAMSACRREGLSGSGQIIVPVRDAIYKGLVAKDDDILIDEDVHLRRGGPSRFNVGFVGSVINAKVRVYYVIKDEVGTETAGPIVLKRGQTEKIKFSSKLTRGGRVAVFARGADVQSDVFGDLTTDTPYSGKVLDDRLISTLEGGFFLAGTGASKVIAFYTPP